MSTMLTPHDALRSSIADVLSAYRDGSLDPREVCEAALARARALDPGLRAYRTLTDDLAWQQAADAAVAYRDGTSSERPLLGIPIAIKDVFHVAGEVSALGSVWHRHDRQRVDSGVVRRLRAAGAVFVGKTNVPEFCQSSSTESLLDLDTANPWDRSRTPGGSSGGSAAAIASQSCLAALGSDGGGSIRIPAAFTGLVGLKPTYGRVLDEGGFEGFADFAAPGPIGWRVDDARRVFGVLAETMPRRRPVERLRIAGCVRPEGRPVDPGVAKNFEVAIAELDRLGHDVDEVELPVHDWYKAFGPLLVADEFARRGHLLDHAHLLTPYERATLHAGSRTSPKQLDGAHEARQRLRDVLDATLADHDLLATPTTAVPAYPLGERPTEIDGVRVSRLWGATPFTAAFNLTGNPAIAIPSGLAAGLPTSVQLVAAHGRDELLLDTAAELEEALDLRLFEQLPDLNSYAAAP